MPEPRRILFDAYWWTSGPPSGRNVVRSLVRTWCATLPDDDVTLAVRPGARAAVESELADLGLHASVRSVAPWARIHGLAARTLGGRDADVVLTQNFATRARDALSCAFVHDAMFAEHPEWFGRVERAYLSGLRPSLRDADLVLTSSHTEARRIARVWPETAPRVHAIGLHPPLDFAETRERRPDSVPDGPFVLVVGRLNVRKNLRRLVEAFLRSPATGRRRLLVVGQPDGLGESLPSTEDRVHVLQHVDDAGLRWLYAHADLFVFPSLDEGFGLPLVEARSVGARAIVSDIAVFRELDLAEARFDPHSVDDIERTLTAALGRPGSRQRVVGGGWADTVAAMNEHVERALAERGAHVPAA